MILFSISGTCDEHSAYSGYGQINLLCPNIASSPCFMKKHIQLFHVFFPRKMRWLKFARDRNFCVMGWQEPESMWFPPPFNLVHLADKLQQEADTNMMDTSCRVPQTNPFQYFWQVQKKSILIRHLKSAVCPCRHQKTASNKGKKTAPRKNVAGHRQQTSNTTPTNLDNRGNRMILFNAVMESKFHPSHTYKI